MTKNDNSIKNLDLCDCQELDFLLGGELLEDIGHLGSEAHFNDKYTDPFNNHIQQGGKIGFFG